MTEKFLILERSVRADVQAIEQLFESLGAPDLSPSDPEEKLIVIAYRLHSLYSAFENLFRNIAGTFESEMRDPSGWHRELLQRMKLDLTPIRPAVIDEEAYAKLEELLRFRHFFRTAYSVPLDPSRLSLALSRCTGSRSRASSSSFRAWNSRRAGESPAPRGGSSPGWALLRCRTQDLPRGKL
jgi:hypothetical protein